MWSAHTLSTPSGSTFTAERDLKWRHYLFRKCSSEDEAWQEHKYPPILVPTWGNSDGQYFFKRSFKRSSGLEFKDLNFSLIHHFPPVCFPPLVFTSVNPLKTPCTPKSISACFWRIQPSILATYSNCYFKLLLEKTGNTINFHGKSITTLAIKTMSLVEHRQLLQQSRELISKTFTSGLTFEVYEGRFRYWIMSLGDYY